MDLGDRRARLSQLSTAWTALFQAHQGPADAASEAKRQLLSRCGGAIYQYLLGAMRDPDAADELFQEFALRFVRGDFHRASPDRGRFRDFLKTSLYHLIVDAQKKRQHRGRPLDHDVAEPQATPASFDEADRRFRDAWRAELLDLAWAELQAAENTTGRPLYTVLRFRTDHPELRSTEAAERLSKTMDKPISAEWVRKWLLLGRQEFSRIIRDAVAQSLADPTEENLEEELIDLGLFEYCRQGSDRGRIR